jgi:hypothetical protein
MHAKEVHHGVPRHLLRAHDRLAAHTELDGEGMDLALEFEELAMRYGIGDAGSLTREELAERIESSSVELPREEHRKAHAADWREWGSRGGKATLARYGRRYFSLLALRRHDKIVPGELLAVPGACIPRAAIPASVSRQPNGRRLKAATTMAPYLPPLG